MLLAPYFVGMMIVFGMGLAAFFSTLQIYFRDTSAFLPFFVRLWMYLSPVLWLPEAIFASEFPRWMLTLIQVNPLYSMLGGYADAVQEERVPDLSMWITSGAWAVGVAVLGFLFFISREREFAVRLS